MNAPSCTRTRVGNWALGASAAVLLVIVLSQIGRLAAGNMASADLVNQSGDYQMLAVHGGLDDVMMMVDQRSESVLIYRATQSGVQFFGRRDLKELFFQARQAAGK